MSRSARIVPCVITVVIRRTVVPLTTLSFAHTPLVYASAAIPRTYMNTTEFLLKWLKQKLAKLAPRIDGLVYIVRHVLQSVICTNFAVKKLAQVKATGERDAAEFV